MPSVLAPWGFDDIGETVYRAILARPGVRPEQIADEHALALDDVLRVARRLVRTGLVRRYGGGVAALRPDVGLGMLIQRTEQSLRERASDLDQLPDLVPRLVLDHTLGERDRRSPSAVTTVGSGDELAAVVQRLVGDGTRLDVAVASAMPLPLDWGLLGAPGRTRVLGDAPDSLVAPAGAEVRVAPHVPVTVLVTGRGALLARSAAGFTLVEVASVVAALTSLFERLWTHAVALHPAREDRPPGDDRLVEMLGQGWQDEAIAEALGISLRTVRRRVAELMDVLDSRTRFQAGVQSARRELR